MARPLSVAPIKAESRRGTLQTGKALAVFAKPTDQEDTTRILALRFSSDDSLLAAGSYSLIRLRSSSDGSMIADGLYSLIRIWDVEYG